MQFFFKKQKHSSLNYYSFGLSTLLANGSETSLAGVGLFECSKLGLFTHFAELRFLSLLFYLVHCFHCKLSGSKHKQRPSSNWGCGWAVFTHCSHLFKWRGILCRHILILVWQIKFLKKKGIIDFCVEGSVFRNIFLFISELYLLWYL